MLVVGVVEVLDVVVGVVGSTEVDVVADVVAGVVDALATAARLNERPDAAAKAMATTDLELTSQRG